MIIRYRERAVADIDEIYRYLRERSPVGAENVLRQIRVSVEFIAEQPLSSPKTDVPNVRVKIVRRYRYKIFYEIVEDVVEIVHVRHTSRRPWDAKSTD